MITEMPARERRTAGKGSRPAGTKDVFARLDAETVERFDELVDRMRPRTTRSGMIADLIRQYVEKHWHEQK